MPPPTRAPGPPPAEPRLPNTPPAVPAQRGWCAVAWLDSAGNRVTPRTPGSIVVVAICVHRRCPSQVHARLDLVDACIAIAVEEAAGHPALVVLPGGFFGFDAEAWWQGAPDPWAGLGLTPADDAMITARVGHAANMLGVGSAVVFGRDDGMLNRDQVAWVIQRGVPAPQVIRRGSTSIAARHVQVGPVRATVFVCGEFTNSRTRVNGPFDGRTYLNLHDPATSIVGTGVLVDVAHAHVRGTVEAENAGPRNVHQRQMEEFSSSGASVLVHHHDGAKARKGHTRCDCASDWIMFRGGLWLEEQAVQPIP